MSSPIGDSMMQKLSISASSSWRVSENYYWRFACRTICHLNADPEGLMSRIDNLVSRGMAVPPGKNFVSLYAEHYPLYIQAVDFTVTIKVMTPGEVVWTMTSILTHRVRYSCRSFFETGMPFGEARRAQFQGPYKFFFVDFVIQGVNITIMYYMAACGAKSSANHLIQGKQGKCDG